MDASRLLEVLADIDKEIEGGQTRLLSALVQQYTVARDSPTTDNAALIQKALASLIEYVDQGSFSQYPPSKAAILQVIDGNTRVGKGFTERLNTTLSISGQTTAGIVTSLSALQLDLGTFKKACTQTKTGLEALGIAPHKIPTGEFEVGVLIPQALVDGKLSSLVKELGVWNRILRGFKEVAGEEDREVTVAGLASGSYETYIPLGIAAAHYLSMTIDKVFEWYSKILEMRKLRQELKNLGAPTSEATAIQKHEKDLIEKGIEGLAKEIVKAAHPKIEANRRHELETQVSISIRQITRFVDKGGTVEVASTPPEPVAEPTTISEAATPEEKKSYDELLQETKQLKAKLDQVSEIMRSGSRLRQLPTRTEPILQLEVEQEEEDAVSTERVVKKKAEK